MFTKNLTKVYGFALFFLAIGLATFYNNCGQYKFSSVSSPNLNSESGATNVEKTGDGIPETPPISFTSTNCTIGYPRMSSNPATNIDFNESDVLAAFTPGGSISLVSGNSIAIWYSDEHAMVLGVRQVNVISAAGTSTSNYETSGLSSIPGVQTNPHVGANAQEGGVDTSLCPGSTSAQDSCSRPMFPALFVTDITTDPSSVAGDWQSGGIAIGPTAVYGTWKSAVKTVDLTVNPSRVAIAVDSNPAKNDWNLGAGVPIPSNAASIGEGYSSMVSWDITRLGLATGHTYRIQFMVHDGDQTKAGGDVGENCVNLQVR